MSIEDGPRRCKRGRVEDGRGDGILFSIPISHLALNTDNRMDIYLRSGACTDDGSRPLVSGTRTSVVTILETPLVPATIGPIPIPPPEDEDHVARSATLAVLLSKDRAVG